MPTPGRVLDVVKHIAALAAGGHVSLTTTQHSDCTPPPRKGYMLPWVPLPLWRHGHAHQHTCRCDGTRTDILHALGS